MRPHRCKGPRPRPGFAHVGPGATSRRGQQVHSSSTADSFPPSIPDAASAMRYSAENLERASTPIGEIHVVLAHQSGPRRYRLLIEDRYPEVVVPAQVTPK